MENNNLLNDLKNYNKDINSLLADKKGTKEVCNRLNLKNSTLFAYGSTPYSTFENLYNNISKKPKRFIVVGSSVGWINFYWNDLFPNIETIGIDIHHVRTQFAQNLIDKYHLKNISFLNKDFKNFKFQNGDLIWQSNLCFDKQELEKTNDIILQKTPNISLISYKQISSNKEIKKDTKIIKLPTSWSTDQRFFIYESK